LEKENNRLEEGALHRLFMTENSQEIRLPYYTTLDGSFCE